MSKQRNTFSRSKDEEKKSQFRKLRHQSSQQQKMRNHGYMATVYLKNERYKTTTKNYKIGITQKNKKEKWERMNRLD